MKDALLDIVKHTYNLGVIELVKITGTDEKTSLSAVGKDKTVVLDATLHNAVPEFIGQFGMPSLNKLNTILSIPEYQEEAKLTINYRTKDNKNYPAGIRFENKSGDFVNDYRFMSTELVIGLVPDLEFKQPKWDVTFEPAINSIQRLRYQSSANDGETTFVAKVENSNLKFYFGNNSSDHAGEFVFASNVSGSLTKSWNWPIGIINSILSLPGDKIMKFSDGGASQITVDSGIGVYNYIIIPQQK